MLPIVKKKTQNTTNKNLQNKTPKTLIVLLESIVNLVLGY